MAENRDFFRRQYGNTVAAWLGQSDKYFTGGRL